MEILIFWIILSVFVGMLGSGRNIGFAGAFFISLLLSPIIGFIVTIISKDKDDEKHKDAVLKNQQAQTQALQQTLNKSNQHNVTELERISKLKKEGYLTEVEYQKLKNNIISKFD